MLHNEKKMFYAFFWVIPRVWILYANVSEHSVCSIFIPTRLWRWKRQSFPKLWHIIFMHTCEVEYTADCTSPVRWPYLRLPTTVTAYLWKRNLN